MLPYQLGRYRLMELLGEGGMARVFRALLQGPAGFEKTVAIKLLKATTQHRGAGSELMQEAVVASRIHHPNIVDVYELGEERGCPFIAMEWVDGLPLTKLLNPKVIMPASVVLDLLIGLLNGLEQAHTKDPHSDRPRVLHRDIKPSNIIVSKHGVPKLVDFGTAAAIDESVGLHLPANRKIIGTLSWMSPEQMLGEPLDVRSDLFAFGLVMAAVVICRNPLGRRYLYQLVKDKKEIPDCLITIEDESALDAHIPGLGRLVSRVLSRDRRQRPPSAKVLRDELSALRRHVGHRPTVGQWMLETFGPAPEEEHVSINDTTWVMEGPEPIAEAHTATVNPGNLPKDDALFVGREEEFALLQGHIELGDPLVTLVGTGGAGKTRLSRRMANHFAVQFAGGAWFVDLADVESLDGIVRAVAQSMGIHMPANVESNPVLQLGTELSKRGRLLIVLDNFEQLVEHGTNTVGQWLESAKNVQFLVTTREALNLANEVRVPLPPLSQEEAVDLLWQRAQMMGASWSEDEGTQGTLVRIVDALDRLPLAIELAAVRARILSPVQLWEKLEERFQLLRSGARDQVERQATLHGLIDWSWRRLSEWEQSALAQLSCFRGGFSMEAAEAILDVGAWAEAPWSLDVIGSLIEKSLIRHDQIDGEIRLSMFVSIRAFAEAKLGEEAHPITGPKVLESTHARHAQYFAGQSPVEVSGSFRVVDPTVRRVLHRNLDNLLVSAQHGAQPHRALCGIGALEVLMAHGPVSQVVTLVDSFLAAGDTPPKLEFRMRLIQTRCYRMMGCLADAQAAMKLAVACAEQAELKPSSDALLDLNEVAARLPEGEGPEISLEIDQRLVQARLLRAEAHNVEAQKILEEALALCSPTRMPTLQAKVQHALGWVMWTKGDVDASLVHLKESRAAYRVAGLPKEEVMSLSALAYLQYCRGNYRTAHAQFMECLEILEQVGEQAAGRLFLSKLGNLERAMGDYESSLEHFEQGIVLQDQIGDVMTSLGNRIDRCRTLIAMGRMDEAETELNEIVATTRQRESKAYEGLARSTLADIYLEQDRLPEAVEALRFAHDQFHGKIPVLEVSVGIDLAVALARSGELEGLDDLTQGQEQHVALLPPAQLSFICKLAEVRQYQQEPAASYAHIQRAKEVARKMEDGGSDQMRAKLAELEKRILGSS